MILHQTVALNNLSHNPGAKRSCSVGLQADTGITTTCPPEGGRYTNGAYRTQPAEAIAVPHLSRSDVSSLRNSRPSTAYPIPAIKTMTTTI